MTENSSASSEPESIDAQIQRMDALLAQGREAMARVDAFYREHDLVPGFGEQMLQSEDVPERHRTIFAKLISELSRIDQRIDELDPNKKTAPPISVGARAVGNRYRI
jgi:hypothetical protein